MFFEGFLQLAHERAFHPHLDVVPMFRVLGVPRPLLGETNSAGKPDPAVDHENAAMRAAIGAIHSPGKERMVIGKFAARILHHSDVGIIQLPTGADAVEQDAHFHSGPGAFDEGVAKRPADFVGVNNVGLEVDRLFRAPNGGQHGGEISVSILEEIDFVSA